ncbi:MAG: TetR/AcrR family transcriptional regulator [Desulfobacter sp.]|nr:TetR/AcrR family transcriptional regulator [Desulfobacter sp.]WDP84969.1 MAG: TetR/AcrR family transcriptional regulator [Desulfobacter sp.]
MKHRGKTNPPGRIKIMKSFSKLMKEKDFHSITTAEIARNGSVTEGLIYKYFKDKKDLLHQLLNDHFTRFLDKIEARILEEKTCRAQLEIVIFSSLESYAENRLFSKMLFLEVRSSPEYYSSGAYARVRKYAAIILGIIQQGIDNGEIKEKTDPVLLRKVILGAIEHACLGELIFGRALEIDTVASGISDIIFNGVNP